MVESMFLDFGENSPVVPRTARSEAKNIAILRSWIEEIRGKPLLTTCYGSREESVSNQELLVKNAPCHQKGAIQRFVAFIMF